MTAFSSSTAAAGPRRIDAASGDILWPLTRISEVTPLGGPRCRGPRGWRIHGGFHRADGSYKHVLARDMRLGRMVRDTVIAPAGARLRITAAPIVGDGL